ncbi:hypothetical protein V9T40_010602 [Parthenolecanium corni]|uniref:Uncharacterized protein n=1 Tax=Parthenolecanium corni TaxID=536013 RepID=A0AAN9T5I1_9HEMI
MLRIISLLRTRSTLCLKFDPAKLALYFSLWTITPRQTNVVENLKKGAISTPGSTREDPEDTANNVSKLPQRWCIPTPVAYMPQG